VDVKEKFFSFLSARRGMAACIQPDLHLEKLFASCSRQTVASRRFLSMVSCARVVGRLRFRKLRKQNGVA
jgi:hypothetical protein